jgi:hypothetical protein
MAKKLGLSSGYEYGPEEKSTLNVAASLSGMYRRRLPVALMMTSLCANGALREVALFEDGPKCSLRQRIEIVIIAVVLTPVFSLDIIMVTGA